MEQCEQEIKLTIYKPLKVLLIEDELVAAKVHKQYLEKMGLEVDVAEDGKQAFEKFISNHSAYSLIVLDGRLPYIDGFTLAWLIRRLEIHQFIERIPLILISAEYEIKESSELAGIDDYVKKPVSYELLKDMVFHWIQK